MFAFKHKIQFLFLKYLRYIIKIRHPFHEIKTIIIHNLTINLSKHNIKIIFDMKYYIGHIYIDNDLMIFP